MMAVYRDCRGDVCLGPARSWARTKQLLILAGEYDSPSAHQGNSERAVPWLEQRACVSGCSVDLKRKCSQDGAQARARGNSKG